MSVFVFYNPIIVWIRSKLEKTYEIDFDSLSDKELKNIYNNVLEKSKRLKGNNRERQKEWIVVKEYLKEKFKSFFRREPKINSLETTWDDFSDALILEIKRSKKLDPYDKNTIESINKVIEITQSLLEKPQLELVIKTERPAETSNEDDDK